MPWKQKAITAHLVDVETGQRLEFQYNPNDIVDEKSTAYAAIKIPGLSHPRYRFFLLAVPQGKCRLLPRGLMPQHQFQCKIPAAEIQLQFPTLDCNLV